MFTPGTPKPAGSGRKRGQPNRITLEVAEKLRRLDCDPMEGMATIASNKLPCGVCRGTGRSHYKLAAGVHAKGCDGKPSKTGLCKCEGIGERTCESCYGTLYEACSPELRGKMHSELAQYVAPKRKAIDHSNSDGSMRPTWTVTLAPEVKAPAKAPPAPRDNKLH